jgi:hypothetical protein
MAEAMNLNGFRLASKDIKSRLKIGSGEGFGISILRDSKNEPIFSFIIKIDMMIE